MKKKPDNVADNPLTTPYGTNVSAPAITLPDIAGYRDIKSKEAGNKLKARYEELQAEFKKLVETAENNRQIYEAQISFVPVVGKVYYLYRKPDGTEWISMVGPKEWGPDYQFEFLGTFRLATDSVWIREDG